MSALWVLAASLASAATLESIPPLPASAIQVAGWDAASAIAGRLADAQDLSREGYSLYRENVARYLYNAYPDAALASLDAAGVKSLRELPAVPRWTEKLERDVAKPYSDADVDAHLDRLQSELVGAAEMLRGFKSEASFRLVLMGGIMRGRFSANSDLDVVLHTDDRELFAKAMESPYGYLVKDRLVILSPPARNKRVGRALGPTLDLGDASQAERPGFLRDVFKSRREGLDLARQEREVPLDKLEVMVQLKKLSKRALRYPAGSRERPELEERMRLLSKSLEPRT